MLERGAYSDFIRDSPFPTVQNMTVSFYRAASSVTHHLIIYYHYLIK